MTVYWCNACVPSDPAECCIVVVKQNHPAPIECPYVEFNEHGECITMPPKWKVLIP